MPGGLLGDGVNLTGQGCGCGQPGDGNPVMTVRLGLGLAGGDKEPGF